MRSSTISQQVEVSRRAAERWLLLAVPLSLIGCRSDCDPVTCSRVDQNATSTDIRVELASGVLFAVTIDGEQGLATTSGGEVVASADDWYCWSTSTVPCRITLKRLRLQFSRIEFETTAGNTVRLQEVTSAIATPLVLEDSGLGYEVPSGTKVISSLDVDGQSDCGEASTAQSSLLSIDVFQQILTFDGTLPLTFHLTNNNCQQLSGQLSGLIGGVRPWAQFP